MKTKKTIQKVSEETLKIESFLKECKDGEYLSYRMIERETGVKMDNPGKSYLRRAMKRLKIEYSCIYGDGIKLADSDTAGAIVTNKLVKIDRAVKRGERSHRNITKQFWHDLSDDEKRRILYVGAAFGAIRIAAENGKQMMKKKDYGNYKKLEFPNIDID